MIIEERMIIGDKDFIKRYSDIGLNIKCVQTGCVYDVAIDIADAPFTYVETDEPLDGEDEEETEEEDD